MSRSITSIRHLRSAPFTSFNELVATADERQLAKTIARYGRVDLLCIDEFLSQV